MRGAQVSRARLIGLWAATFSLLLAGVGSAYIRQGPTELSVDSAVEEFRRTTGTSAGEVDAESPDGAEATIVPGTNTGGSGPATTAPPADAGAPGTDPGDGAGASTATGLPPPREGVYPHRTEGFERTDALGGSRHDYPPETSVTVRKSGCGITERWQPLEERWDESDLCAVGEAVEIRVFRKYNEFFQRSQQQTYNCPPGARVFDRSQPIGAKWTWQCASDSAQIRSNVTVVGHEMFGVGGRQIEVVRMRYDSVISGTTRGHQLQERLIERSTGQVVSVKSDVEVRSESPFGEVGYEEHFLIESKSMEPRT